MRAEPSTSREYRAIANLQALFPQVEADVLRAVLEQEGSEEAAVEALLLSVVRTALLLHTSMSCCGSAALKVC